MAPTKKNKLPRQSTTLHQFFGSTSGASPQTKNSADVSRPAIEPPKSKGKAKAQPRSEEIIVICSSNDEEVEIVETKAPTKRSGRDENQSSHSKTKRRKLSRSPSIDLSFDNFEYGLEESFGRPDPQLLPSLPDPLANPSTSEAESSTSALDQNSFGKPTNGVLNSSSESKNVNGTDNPESSFITPTSPQTGFIPRFRAADINAFSASLLPPTDGPQSDSEPKPEFSGATDCSPVPDSEAPEDWGLGDDEADAEDLDNGDDDDAAQDDADMQEVEITSPASPLPTRPPLSPTAPTSTNAFTHLMTSHTETKNLNQAWKEAQQAEDRNFRPTKANGGRRKAPFYKVMQGMPIAVDAFRYGYIPGVTAYFLTHAHSDHYTNLSSSWKDLPIYCSEGTANLIIHLLRVDPKWIKPLPLDIPTLIPETGGVQVTLIEANHCPGSTLFLFEGPLTCNAGDSTYKSPYVGSSRVFRYLHCGDFRASPQHVLHPAVKGKRIDLCYLDTTYLDPKYCFPPQPLVIDACAELAKRLVTGQSLSSQSDLTGRESEIQARISLMHGWIKNLSKPKLEDGKGKEKESKVLVVVGTYSIGKERIVKAIAHALSTKVYCDPRKASILRCQPDPELHSLLTKDPLDAGVHLVPLGVITSDRLKEYVARWKGKWDKAVGFRPTGWTYTAPNGTDTLPSIPTILSRSQSRTFTHHNLTPTRASTSTIQLYGVPYSEHSSFFELTCFALSFEWTRMIATVNVGSERSRSRMKKWFEMWEKERKKKGEVKVVEFRRGDYW